MFPAVLCANAERPALAKCLKALKAGDVLTIWKLDRLGRSLRDLIALLDDLKQQGVAFQSLAEAIDTETPTGDGCGSRRENEPQAAAVRATGRSFAQAGRAGGRP